MKSATASVGDGLKDIARCLQQVERASNRRLWEVFRDWVECSAICLANTVSPDPDRESCYMRHVERYGPESMTAFARALAALIESMEREPEDLLGRLFMSLDFGNQYMGQFFTPYHLCQAMAQMAFSKAEVEKHVADKGYITGNDPACGGGGQLVALAMTMKEHGFNPQQQLHVTAQDLDITCVHMTYIQLALLGIPGIVYHMNTLSLETFSVWHTPFHVIGGWELRRR